MRYLEATRAAAEQQSARLWTVYEAQERAARGLLPAESLDTRNGVRLPLAQAVTNSANGYVLPIVSDDGAVAALPLDDWALAQQGRGGVNVAGHKDESALDTRLRDRLDPSRPATTTPGGPLGNPRPR